MARTAVPQFDLYGYDAEKRQQFPLLCGVDEAGRGPLAGDVYAAAVILSPEHLPEGLNDSKKLSEKKRELLFPQIQEQAIAYCIATASVAEIEAYNILGATMLAMQRAVAGLSVQPNHVLIDGNRMPELSVSAETVVKGDAHSATIAAASILARWREITICWNSTSNIRSMALPSTKAMGQKHTVRQFCSTELLPYTGRHS